MKLIFESYKDDKEESGGYLPGIDINRLSIGMLLDRLDANGSEAFKIDHQQHSAHWEATVRMREDYLRQCDQILLKEL